MNTKRPVFTIGHGAASFGDLLPLFEQHGVTTLVDVRTAPYSKHAPEFTKAALEQHCRTAGLGYRWMGDRLGGGPGAAAPRPASPGPAFEGGIGELAQLADAGRVAVLCSEADPARCHRASVVAPVLEGLGYEVRHLLHDGTAMLHQPGLFDGLEA